MATMMVLNDINAAPTVGEGRMPLLALMVVVMATWFGAEGFCDFYGWRLPSRVEWEKAARGEDGRPYPWGLEIRREKANYYSSHDVFEKADYAYNLRIWTTNSAGPDYASPSVGFRCAR